MKTLLKAKKINQNQKYSVTNMVSFEMNKKPYKFSCIRRSFINPQINIKI